MKQILIAVTGASPQVLTETLFALNHQGKTMPDEVFVITTANSKLTLEEGLFQDGHWNKLIEDYQLSDIKFSSENIWLISDEEGNVLDDAKAETDQVVMADFITRKVEELTRNDDVAIHASIAGGRKTMAFYMGYAVSLYGREQDVLSHVFVDDDFEFVSEFYYPTPYDKYIVGRDKQKVVNTKDAKVTLAEIPFVRMRSQVDESIYNQMQSHSFSKTVSALNSAHSSEIKVKISTKDKTLDVAGVPVKLTAKALAIYLFFVKKAMRTETLGRTFEDEVDQTREYLEVLDSMKADVRLYKSMGLEDEGQWRQNDFELTPKLTKDFVRQSLSAFHKTLEGRLVPDIVDKIKVHSDGAKAGSRYSVSSDIVIQIDGTYI